ncbi:piggyBac transposable element-derived protein 4 [Trichonephila clavipes]|nr:piggyBac transposable element-derived protein 4 [Trichonephila clavipes]
MMQYSESDDFSDSDYEEVDIEKIVEVMLLYVAYIFYCKSGGSRSPKQFRMELIEKIISENHRDEFSATSGRPSISPSPPRLTSGHFADSILDTEKKIIKSNETVHSVLP